MAYAKLFGIIVVCSVLASCGKNLGEQALFGAGAGGAATAVAGGDDADIATGALAGGAANVAYCQNYPSRC